MFAGITTGLWADDVSTSSALQQINRPLRTIRPDSSFPGDPIPHSSFFVSPSLLLTPENLNQPLTRHYIERYSNTAGINWINTIIKNGNTYLPFIKNEIAQRGLPPELAYLPVIESGFISSARSKSGAVGLWQFMMNSIGSSMKVNDLLDERRDFRKSTAAALQKLEENYRALGSWPLALAAYNAGLGGVRQAIQQGKTDDYWILCEKKVFKTETIHYVPKLLAISYILSSPRKFGVDYWPETVEWTTIKPGRQASLDAIASETGTDRNLLRRLNMELLHGVTPADKNYELKIPAAQAVIITGILEKKDVSLLQYHRYQIQYGDTLSGLSRDYGVSINLIEQHNPGIRSRYLQIGEIILIPAYSGGPAYSGRTSAPPPPAAQSPGGNFRGTYTVSKGDTLWSLAILYGVDPQILARENNMDLDQILSVGKILKVPIIE